MRALTEDERTNICVWRIGVAYSDRSASTALILVARSAGRDAARIATKSNTSGALTNVGGSNAGIPYRNDEISLASQIETATDNDANGDQLQTVLPRTPLVPV